MRGERKMLSNAGLLSPYGDENGSFEKSSKGGTSSLLKQDFSKVLLAPFNGLRTAKVSEHDRALIDSAIRQVEDGAFVMSPFAGLDDTADDPEPIRLLQVSLPKWDSYDKASSADQKTWDQAVDKLQSHETDHENTNREGADALDKSLPGTSETGTAKNANTAKTTADQKLDSAVQQKFKENQQQTDKNNQALDDCTNHGLQTCK
jgi:hypothetical protein